MTLKNETPTCILTNFEVAKKKDGLLVRQVATGRIDYLNFWEGVGWRLIKKLPSRFLSWPDECDEITLPSDEDKHDE